MTDPTEATEHPFAPGNDLDGPDARPLPPPPTRESMAAYQAGVARAAAAERARRERDELATEGNLREGLEALLRRAAEQGERRKSLPCYPEMEAGRVAAAADACWAVRGRKICPAPFASSAECCAILLDEAPHRQATERLDAARALELEADLCGAFIETIPGRRGPGGARLSVREVLPTAAMLYVSAFVEQGQALVGKGEPVDLAGKRLVVIAGPPGTGKTWAGVCALAREGGMMLKAPEIEDPPGSSKEHRLRVAALLERARRSAFLVLDDAGIESPGYDGAHHTTIATLLCDRYARGLFTLVTTNLLRERPAKVPDAFPPQFVERYGRRVVDRIAERGAFLVVKGESLRGRPRGRAGVGDGTASA